MRIVLIACPSDGVVSCEGNGKHCLFDIHEPITDEMIEWAKKGLSYDAVSAKRRSEEAIAEYERLTGEKFKL